MGDLKEYKTDMEWYNENVEPKIVSDRVSTLKEDILAALRKERKRLDEQPKLSASDEDRLSNCLEFIKRINQSDESHPAELVIRNIWTEPLKL